MEDNLTIGKTLRAERENRGLSLEEVHDATKITAQNLAAIEEDRFDSFPNKVYARAFLRDYANFLNLDSSGLLTRYEEEWGTPREPAISAPTGRGSAWKRVGYAFVVLVLLGGAGAYVYYSGLYARVCKPAITRSRPVPRRPRTEVAALPRVPKVIEKPQVEKPKPAKEPVAAPAPPPLGKLTIEMTALRLVWAEVQVDGVKQHYGNFGPGTKTFVGKSKVYIKVGQANAVRIRKNGVEQPSLGKLAVLGKVTYTLPPPSGAPPAGTTPAPPGKTETTAH